MESGNAKSQRGTERNDQEGKGSGRINRDEEDLPVLSSSSREERRRES